MPADPIRKVHIAKDATSTLVLPRRRVLVVAFHDWSAPKLVQKLWSQDTITVCKSRPPMSVEVEEPAIDPALKWNCIHNPSGRLLLGKPYKEVTEPSDELYLGPLVSYLKNSAPYTKSSTVNDDKLEPVVIDWVFDTLTVTWDIASTCSKITQFMEFDVIIIVGLGVYYIPVFNASMNLWESAGAPIYNKINLEYGAHSFCIDTDADGNTRNGWSSVTRDILLPTNPDFAISGIADRMIEFFALGSRTELNTDVTYGPPRYGGGNFIHKSEYLSQKTLGYDVYLELARLENAYVCNNTHYIALKCLKESLTNASVGIGSRLRQVYCIHIPYASGQGNPDEGPNVWNANGSSDADYEKLANAVGALIHELVSF